VETTSGRLALSAGWKFSIKTNHSKPRIRWRQVKN